MCARVCVSVVQNAITIIGSHGPAMHILDLLQDRFHGAVVARQTVSRLYLTRSLFISG